MTIIDPVATYAKMNPHGQAMVDLETSRSWSYAELHALINRTAAWLVAEVGPASGERIAILSKNCAEMLVLQWACVRSGCIFVPLNWRLAEPEIEGLVKDADPILIFVQETFNAPTSVRRVQSVEDMLSLGVADSAPPIDARRAFDDVSTILFTSGTSGTPKGVKLSEENVFFGASNFLFGNDVTTQSAFLCDMPLFHVAGLFAAARVPLLAGGRVLISVGFEAATTLSRLSDPELKVTHYFSVPQMAAWIWNEPNFDAEKLQSIKSWAIGGAPNPRAVAERFINAGIRIADGFGMSEICSAFGMPPQSPDILLEKAGSCGPAFLGIETRIVDEDGNDLPPGEMGELWLRGPSISKGYWNKPEATAEAFRDGWFLTGDAGKLDEDGFLYIVDRKKDMFISGGENVYPAEVEAILAELPGVAESAVVGVPDEKWGEVGRAYIIPVPGQSVEVEDVRAHCLERLAKFKIPKTVVIAQTLPRTASGKLQKHVLRARAEEEISQGD